MANYTSKILGNSISSLNAQQASIAVTANNIANVNTPGYARRVLELESRQQGGDSKLGSGVAVGQVLRIADNFLERLLRDATSGIQSNKVKDEFMERIETYFALDGSFNTIGAAMNSFFAAADDLTTNPASIELRQNFIQQAEDLATSINQTYNALANLQTEADERLRTEIITLNSITEQIAELNIRIKTRESAGAVAADERDVRDQLMQKLSEKIEYQVTEINDGTINISLSNGFLLVSGTKHQEIAFNRNPSFLVGAPPEMLSGVTAGYIVYDHSGGAGTGHEDLTDTIAAGGGSLGGLLAVRGVYSATSTGPFDAVGAIPELALKVEAMAVALLTEVNLQYRGPDEAAAAGLQPTAVDLDGDNPGVFGLFTFAGAVDNDADGNPEDTDLAATGFQNFASRIQVAITNPRDVAAGLDLDTVVGTTQVAAGDGRNMENLANIQTQNIAFSAPATGALFTNTTTFDAVYNTIVADVGNIRNTARVELAVAEASFTTARERRDELSAVSLDEEFSKLISFQRAFEAAARIIRTADELLQQVVSII